MNITIGHKTFFIINEKKKHNIKMCSEYTNTHAQVLENYLSPKLNSNKHSPVHRNACNVVTKRYTSHGGSITQVEQTLKEQIKERKQNNENHLPD